MHPVIHLSPLDWLGVAASITIWGVVIARWSMRRPVIRYQPRRPVPWGGGHVIHSWTVSVPLLLGRLHLNEESAHPQRREEQP